MAVATDLTEFVLTKQALCLNDSPDHPFTTSVIEQGTSNSKTVESDADEELLIFIPFSQVVRLQSIVVRGPRTNGPKTVHIFAGGRGMSFDDCQHQKATEVLELSQDQVESGSHVVLDYSLYQKVECVTLFFENNQEDGDVTAVSGVTFFGVPHGVMNVSEIKKTG